MDSNLVIKVKYGDTLRRFNAHMDGNGSLNLDMGGLRAKILELFKFAPDADLTLTYIDEDNDVVALVDDNDLHDAIEQHLHPLRINVLLNTNRAGRTDSRSSISSTPRSPQMQTGALSHINTSVTDVLKSVPEPVRDALSKLSQDLSSKVASSAPVLTEIVESLTKLGLSQLSSVSDSQRQPGSTLDVQSGASKSGSHIYPKVTLGSEALKDSESISKINSKCVDPISMINPKESNNNNVIGGVGNSAPTTASVDLNLDLPRDCSLSGYPALNFTIPPILESNTQKETDGNPSGTAFDYSTFFPATFSSSVLHGDNGKQQQPSGIGNSPTSQIGFIPQSTGEIVADTSNVVLPDEYDRAHLFKRSYSHSDSIGRIFHKGIRCDGCGAYPITGPRFKSKTKEDYDLCGICFSEIGIEAEYNRMDHPLTYQYPRLLKDFYESFHHPRFRTASLRHTLRRRGVRPCHPKLDSSFIRDVNIMDGTIMAPVTPFTKIWRIHNNGTIVWPQGTQLVWIGGDQLTDRVSFELEIPVEGIHVDHELDIAVDFTSPEQPGRYISYWRMALPSGQKFGQQVWVLIQVQVDSTIEGSLLDGFHGLNLNLPPESSGAKGQDLVDVNLDPFDSGHPEFGHPNLSTELAIPMFDKHPSNDQELDSIVNDGFLMNNGLLVPSSPEMPASLSHPAIDFSVGPSEPFPSTDVPTFPREVIDGNMAEQTLLKELEEMGFDQIDLNKEILRRNEYNLEQSVDDLCSVSEWDPILKELQEMGFGDKEKNRKLLAKNGGSIKRVVLDLLTGENASRIAASHFFT